MTNEEWNELIGLRRAIISLMVRSVVSAVIWAATAWLFLQVLSLIGPSWWLPVLVGSPIGALVGVIESRKLTEQAGFTSFLVTCLACVFVAGAILGSTFLVELYVAPLGGFSRFMLSGAGIIVGSAVAIWFTVMDD